MFSGSGSSNLRTRNVTRAKSRETRLSKYRRSLMKYGVSRGSNTKPFYNEGKDTQVKSVKSDKSQSPTISNNFI